VDSCQVLSDKDYQRSRAVCESTLTDKNPGAGRSPAVLAVIAILGVGYFGSVILALSLIDGQYSPISEAASLYGVGQYAVEMNLGFFIGGIGMIAYALALGIQNSKRKSRSGATLLLVGGLVLIMDSYFTTNVPGQPGTLHGAIHGAGGFIFFTTGPVGTLLVSRRSGLGQALTTLIGLAIGVVLLIAPIDTAGLAERIILLVIFASVIFRSLGLLSTRNRS
jgi:hypothetical protein